MQCLETPQIMFNALRGNTPLDDSLIQMTGAVLKLRPIKNACEKAKTKVEDKEASLKVTKDLIGYVKLRAKRYKNQPSGYEQYEHIRLELQGPAAAQEAEIVEGES
jgi:hypothetical protein